jgi:hypothetical protein
MLDLLENNEGGDSQALMRRLREREGADNQLKVQIGDFETRRDALKEEILSAEIVAENYGADPALPVAGGLLEQRRC